MSFDAPSREFCVVRRPRTNTPLQALTLLNDPVYVEAAQALARRMISEGGDGAASRVARGFRQVLARRPAPGEVEPLISLYQGEIEHYRRDKQAAEALAGKLDETKQGDKADGAKAKPHDVAELAAWTVVANVLLNLDEAVTK
jgi:hypothetical protein